MQLALQNAIFETHFIPFFTVIDILSNIHLHPYRLLELAEEIALKT